MKFKILSSYPLIIKKLHEIDNLSNIKSYFDSSNREEIEITLIATAAKDAERRANQMAMTIGVKLNDNYGPRAMMLNGKSNDLSIFYSTIYSNIENDKCHL
jgi:hypothetical protein